MTVRMELTQILRDQIVGAMHVGQLRSGDRIESVRDASRRLGRNTRTVRAAYRALERDGLVEVRGRSGVFIACQDVPGGEATEETARWLSSVVVEAWKRRIAVPALAGAIERFTAARPVRCGLVEEVEDVVVAMRHELENEFGLEVCCIERDALEEARVDFFAATSFSAGAVRGAVARLGKPLVALTVHPRLREELEMRIRAGCLTVVAVDERFADRIRVSYAADDPRSVRFVSASDARGVAALDRQEAVLLTRAARRVLGGAPLPPVLAHSPTLSPESALALATILVRRNAELALPTAHGRRPGSAD